MKYIKILVVATVFLIGIISFYSAQTFTSGGFGDSTGAPLKRKASVMYNSCNSTTCHGDRAVNSGEGWIDVQSDIPLTGWEAGKTYKITCKAYHPGRYMYGLQFMAWGDKDSLSVGKLEATPRVDSARVATSLIRTAKRDTIGINQYATHSRTSVIKHGGSVNHEFTFRWKAPDVRNQNVRFYLAVVAANGNGLNSGDFVYMISKNADSSSVAIPTRISDFDKVFKAFSIYPTQTSGVLFVQGNVQRSNLRYSVYNSLGQEVAGDKLQDKIIHLPQLSTGNYTILFYNDEVREVHRFQIM